MRYSQEFKDNVVARLLSKELSISEAVEQYSIGKSTISYWLRIAREQAVCGTLPNKGNLKPMTKEERMRLESIRDEDIDYSDVAPSNPEEWKDAVRGKFCRTENQGNSKEQKPGSRVARHTKVPTKRH